MKLLDRFQVVLMPQREVLACGLTMAEAVAYVSGYEEANGDGDCEAVIAVPQSPQLAGSSRQLRRSSRTSAGVRLA